MLIANPIYEAASKYLLEGEGDLSDPLVKKMSSALRVPRLIHRCVEK